MWFPRVFVVNYSLLIYILTVSFDVFVCNEHGYGFYITSGNYSSPTNKLFLTGSTITLKLQLYSLNDTSSTPSRLHLIKSFESLGHTPSITIKNTTTTQTHFFENEINTNEEAWSLTLTRTELTGNRIAEVSLPVEQYSLTIELDYDSGIFTTFATLIDLDTEPLLQWTLGSRLSTLPNIAVSNLILARNPCSADLVLIFPVLAQDEAVVGLSYSGLESTPEWFSMTSLHSACGCTQISIIDVALTNRYLLILTDHGLFISLNILNVQSSENKQLTFTRADLQFSQFVELILHYTSQCLSKMDSDFDSEIVTLGVNSVVSQNLGSWYYSRPPYLAWTRHQLMSKDVIFMAMNRHTINVVSAWKDQASGLYGTDINPLNDSFLISSELLVPSFTFSNSFTLLGLAFHPTTNVLYAYGNQIWVSNDGGSSFIQVAVLNNDNVTSFVWNRQDGAIAMATQNGAVYYGKAGVNRLVRVVNSLISPYCVYIGHIGEVFTAKIDNAALVKEIIPLADNIKTINHAFPRDLVVQYLTSDRVIIHEYGGSARESTWTSASEFHLSHLGLQIQLQNGGRGSIERLKYRNDDVGFLSLINVFIQVPFQFESEVNCSAIQYNMVVKSTGGSGSNVTVKLDGTVPTNGGWKLADIGKTVLIPGEVSVLITERINDTDVNGISVIPLQNIATAVTGRWFVLDMSSTSTVPTWSIYENACHHSFIPNNDVTKNRYASLDLGQSIDLSMIVTRESQQPISEESLSYFFVTLSNPWLFRVRSKSLPSVHGYSLHSMNLEVDSYRLGKSAVNYHLPLASLLCSCTSYTVVIEACCPLGVRLQFNYPIQISDENYLAGKAYNKYGKTVLIPLEVNYRPPSSFGINIPVTHNIYNADPSKPRPRDFHQKSKTTGVFKQCLGKQNRLQCGCHDDMKLSPYEMYTDCREYVYRLRHPGKSKLNLTLHRKGYPSQFLGTPYSVIITELNSRIDYELSSARTDSQNLMIHDINIPNHTQLLNPNDLTVTMIGSGLYHFRTSLIHGYSFCKLQEEFQFFITDPPIVYPLQYIINFSVAMLIGSIVCGVYMYYKPQHSLLDAWDEKPAAEDIADPLAKQSKQT